jgi:hypothetical protein
VNLATNDGGTPLFIAAQKGHLGVVKWLVEEGKANVKFAMSDGYTPLFIAARKGHLGVVKWLVEEGKANVNLATNEGATPLFIAAQEGHLRLVKYLVREAHADLTPLFEDITALHIAAFRGHAKVVLVLLKHMESTGTVLPEGAMDLADLTKLLPPNIKEKLRLRQCAGCGRMANVGDAKFKACGNCVSVRYWCVDPPAAAHRLTPEPTSHSLCYTCRTLISLFLVVSLQHAKLPGGALEGP